MQYILRKAFDCSPDGKVVTIPAFYVSDIYSMLL